METDHFKLPLPHHGIRFERNLNLLNDLTFSKKNLEYNSLERPSYINLYIYYLLLICLLNISYIFILYFYHILFFNLKLIFYFLQLSSAFGLMEMALYKWWWWWWWWWWLLLLLYEDMLDYRSYAHKLSSCEIKVLTYSGNRSRQVCLYILSAVEIYDLSYIHLYCLPYTGILRTHKVTSYQLACMID